MVPPNLQTAHYINIGQLLLLIRISGFPVFFIFNQLMVVGTFPHQLGPTFRAFLILARNALLVENFFPAFRAEAVTAPTHPAWIF